MANDEAPIKSEDIIAPDVFSPTIEQARVLLPLLQQLDTALKSIASSSGAKIKAIEPNSITSIKQLELETKKLDDVEKAHVQTQKQTKQLTIEIAVAEEKERQSKAALRGEAKATLSAYAALNAESRKADQLARDLAAEYGLTNKQFQEAAINARRLKNELSAIDNSIGNYQRNVGNYNNQLGVLARSVKGFGELGTIIVSALGFDPQVFTAIREAGRGLRDLNHIKSEEKIVEGDVALAKTVAAKATEENTVASIAENAAVSEGIVLTKAQEEAQAEYLATLEVTTPAIAAETVVTEVQTVATTQATIATRVWAGTVNLLTGSILGLAAIIGLALGALYQLYRINTSLDEQTKDILTNDLKRIDVLKDLVRGGEQLSKQAKDTADNQLRQNELLGKSFKELEDIKKENLKAEGEANRRAIDNQKTLLDGYNKLATDLDKIDLSKVTKEQKEKIIDLYNSTLDNIQQTKDKISDLGQNAIGQETKKAEINHDINERILTDALATANAKALITKNSLQQEFDAKKDAAKKEYDLELFKVGNNQPQKDLALAQYNDKIRELTIAHYNELNKIDEQYASAKIASIKNSYDKQIATEQESIEKRNVILADTTKKFTKKEIDAINLLNEISQDKIDNIKIDKQLASLKAVADINLSQAKKNSIQEYQAKQKDLEVQRTIDLQKAKETEASNQEIDAINEKYRKLEEQEDEKFFDYQKQRTIDADKAKIINLQLSDANESKIRKAQIEEIKAEEAKALAEVGISEEKKALIIAETNKKIRDINNKAIEEQIEQVKRFEDIFIKSLNNQLEYQQKVNQQKLDDTDKQLQQQAILLAAGQQNTYDALLRQKAKAQAEQAALDKQAKRDKDAEQFASVALDAFEGALKSGKSVTASLAQALEALGAAKGLSIIAGSFHDGTPDTGGPGTLDSRGGKLAKIHPNEAIIPAAMNKKHGGLAEAWINDDVDGWMMKNIASPQLFIKSKSSELIDAQNSLLLAEIKGMRKDIKNKKEFSNVYDTNGEFIGYIEKENGIQKMVKSNQYDIVKNERIYKTN